MDTATFTISLVGTVVAVACAIIAWASALYARRTWSTSRDAMAQQAIMSILLEYRSAEVMDAVKTLWEFRRSHIGGAMAAEYEEVRKRDDAAWRDANPAARLALIPGTLHYKRRVVSHFYAYLAHLVDLKILPKVAFYKSWSKEDLEIIPQVLVPLEKALGTALAGGDPPILPTLQALYDNAPSARAMAKK
jgi:hypothetical protein